MDKLPLPSNRSFGTLFVVVFALLGLLLLWRGSPVATYLLIASGGVLLVTLLRPRLLQPLNAGWMRLAYLMHVVISPVVLGLLYFGLLTPIGALMRLRGKDPMRRTARADQASYWILREPPGPAPDSFRNQF